MSTDGICHPVFDLHCHRFIGTGADQNSQVRNQEMYVLILALPLTLSKDSIRLGLHNKNNHWEGFASLEPPGLAKRGAGSIMFATFTVGRLCFVHACQALIPQPPLGTQLCSQPQCLQLGLEVKASRKRPLPHKVKLISCNALLDINIHKATLPPKGPPTS